ncbi:hypothetical protein BJX76DRAFT_362814 [Aspergillus varians]
MAELVGVVSAGVGIAAFIIQVAGNIRRLREIRHSSRPFNEVDYDADTYHYRTLLPQPDRSSSNSLWISWRMAEYVIWLEHEYARRKSSGSTTGGDQTWYKRRMLWVN